MNAERERVQTLTFPIDLSTTRVFPGWCYSSSKVIISFVTTVQDILPWETLAMKRSNDLAVKGDSLLNGFDYKK